MIYLDKYTLHPQIQQACETGAHGGTEGLTEPPGHTPQAPLHVTGRATCPQGASPVLSVGVLWGEEGRGCSDADGGSRAGTRHHGPVGCWELPEVSADHVTAGWKAVG